MSVYLQEPHPKRRAGQSFFKLWFENNLHPLRMDFLSIGFCKQTNKQRTEAYNPEAYNFVAMLRFFREPIKIYFLIWNY